MDGIGLLDGVGLMDCIEESRGLDGEGPDLIIHCSVTTSSTVDVVVIVKVTIGTNALVDVLSTRTTTVVLVGMVTILVSSQRPYKSNLANVKASIGLER